MKEASSWRWRQGAFCIGDPGSYYNGSSWEERQVKGSANQKAAVKSGAISAPRVCGMTGNDQTYVYMHNEDYDRPLWFHAISRWAHASLHARFTDPLPWFRLVRKHYVHGAWFTFLTMDPQDMRRPFDQVYPYGLPSDGELWPELANKLALSEHAFVSRQADVRANGLHAGNLFRDGLPLRLRVRRRERSLVVEDRAA